MLNNTQPASNVCYVCFWRLFAGRHYKPSPCQLVPVQALMQNCSCQSARSGSASRQHAHNLARTRAFGSTTGLRHRMRLTAVMPLFLPSVSPHLPRPLPRTPPTHTQTAMALNATLLRPNQSAAALSPSFLLTCPPSHLNCDNNVFVVWLLLAAMHRNSAATWASKNVRINCVAAGLMDAPSSGEVSQEEVTAKAAAEVRSCWCAGRGNSHCSWYSGVHRVGLGGPPGLSFLRLTRTMRLSRWLQR